MVRISTSQLADLSSMSISSDTKDNENNIHSFPAWRLARKEKCGVKAGSLLAVFLIYSFKGIPSSFLWQKGG